MFTERARRYLRWMWLLAALTTAATVLAYLGYFGDRSRTSLDELMTSTNAFYQDHKKILDFLFGKVALLGGATWAIVELVLRMDRVLATLFAKFIARRDTRFQKRRQRLLAEAIPPSSRTFEKPAQVREDPLREVLRRRGFSALDVALEQGRRAIVATTEQVELADHHTSCLKRQLGGAELVQAIILIAQAETEPPHSVARGQRLAEADNALTNALAACPADCDALELRALLRHRVGGSDARGDLNKLIEIARKSEAPLFEARGLRHIAELELRDPTKAAAERAREHFEPAIDVLQKAMRSFHVSEETKTQFAMTCHVAAQSYYRLGRVQLLGNALENGRNALIGLSSKSARELQKKFDDLSKQPVRN